MASGNTTSTSTSHAVLALSAALVGSSKDHTVLHLNRLRKALDKPELFRGLDGTGIARACAAALAESPGTWTAISVLPPRGSALGDEGAAVLAAAITPALASVADLDLGNNFVGLTDAGGAKIIEAASHLPKLTSLDLSSGCLEFGPASAAALIAALKDEKRFPALTGVALFGCKIGDADGAALADGLEEEGVKRPELELDLSMNLLGKEVVGRLKQLAATGSIKLDLSSQDGDDDDDSDDSDSDSSSFEISSVSSISGLTFSSDLDLDLNLTSDDDDDDNDDDDDGEKKKKPAAAKPAAEPASAAASAGKDELAAARASQNFIAFFAKKSFGKFQGESVDGWKVTVSLQEDGEWDVGGEKDGAASSVETSPWFINKDQTWIVIGRGYLAETPASFFGPGGPNEMPAGGFAYSDKEGTAKHCMPYYDLRARKDGSWSLVAHPVHNAKGARFNCDDLTEIRGGVGMGMLVEGSALSTGSGTRMIASGSVGTPDLPQNVKELARVLMPGGMVRLGQMGAGVTTEKVAEAAQANGLEMVVDAPADDDEWWLRKPFANLAASAAKELRDAAPAKKSSVVKDIKLGRSGAALSEKQVQQLWEEYDEDGSGFLEKDEGDKFFTDYLQGQGAVLKPDQLEFGLMMLWRQYDKDGDGRLSQEEMLGGASRPTRAAAPAKKGISANGVKMTKKGKLAVWSQTGAVRKSIKKGDDGWPVEMAAVLRAEKEDRCCKIHIGDQEIGDAGFKSLAEVLRERASGSLKRLNVRMNKIGDDGIAEFLKDGVVWKSLEKIRLSHNQVGNAGLEAIADALASGRLPALTMLYLDFNKIVDSEEETGALGKLREGLAKQKRVAVLSIRHNFISKMDDDECDIFKILELGGFSCSICEKHVTTSLFHCNSAQCEDFDICELCQKAKPHDWCGGNDLTRVECSALNLDESEFIPQFGGDSDSDSDSSSDSSSSEDDGNDELLFVELESENEKLGFASFESGLMGLSESSYMAFVQFAKFLEEGPSKDVKAVVLKAEVPFIGSSCLWNAIGEHAGLESFTVDTAAPGGFLANPQRNGENLAPCLHGNLKKLAVNGYTLEDDGLIALCAAVQDSQLERLELRNVGCTRRGLGRLLQTVNGHATLKELHIGGASIEKTWVIPFSAVSGLKFTFKPK